MDIDEMKAEAESLGIVVDARWNARTLQDRISAAKAPKADAEPEKMFPVKLLKNYRPIGEHNVIERVEHPYPGVGQAGKLWAGTIVELPKTEAVRLMNNVYASVDVGKDAEGRPIRRKSERPMPLAERADALPV